MAPAQRWLARVRGGLAGLVIHLRGQGAFGPETSNVRFALFDEGV